MHKNPNASPVRFRVRAATSVLVMVTLPVLLIFVAATVDIGVMSAVRTELQQIADVAASAAAQDFISSDPSDSFVQQTAWYYVGRNRDWTDSFASNFITNLEIGGATFNADVTAVEFTPGAQPPNSLRLSVSADFPYIFGRVLGLEAKTISASALVGLIPREPIAFWRLGDMVGVFATDETGNQAGEYIGDDVFLGETGALVGDMAAGLRLDIRYDFNGDRIVDNSDVSLLDSHIGHTVAGGDPTDAALDLNGDGVVNTLDSDIVHYHRGHTHALGVGFIEIPHSDRFLLSDGTISLWFNTTNDHKEQGLFSKDSSGYDSGGHLDIRIDDHQVRVRIQSNSVSYYLGWAGKES